MKPLKMMTNDWTIQKIGDICDVQTGKKDVNAENLDGIYPFFTCAQGIHKINTFTFDDEAVLVAGNGFFNVKYYKGKFDAYQRTYVLHKFKNDVRGKYLYYFVKFKLDEITKDNRGSTIRYIRLGDITEQNVPLPDLPHQDKAIETLENALAEVADGQDKIYKAKKLIIKFRQSILASAITGKLSEDWRELNDKIETATTLLEKIKLRKKVKSKAPNKKVEIDVLPALPDKWEYAYFGNIVDDFKYGTSEKSDYSYKGLPVLRIPNVISQKISLDDLKYLQTTKVADDYLVKNGDILIIRSNGSRDLVGKNALVGGINGNYTFASYLIRIRPHLVIPAYVSILLNSSFVRQQLFSNAKSAAGINNINTQELASMIVPIPPAEEQIQIVNKVNNYFSKAEIIEKQIIEAEEKGSKLTQAILAKTFRGENLE